MQALLCENYQNIVEMLSNFCSKAFEPFSKALLFILLKALRSFLNFEFKLRNNFTLSLRDNTRSESEKSFDNKTMNEAHLKNLGKAYHSPQNKGIAQSFRYMRNKPTIIAFKTPSLESYEASKDQGELKQNEANERFYILRFLR